MFEIYMNKFALKNMNKTEITFSPTQYLIYFLMFQLFSSSTVVHSVGQSIFYFIVVFHSKNLNPIFLYVYYYT